MALSLASESCVMPDISLLRRALGTKRIRKRDEHAIAMLLGAVRAAGGASPMSSSHLLHSLLSAGRSAHAASVQRASEATIACLQAGSSFPQHSEASRSSQHSCALDELQQARSNPSEAVDVLLRVRSLWEVSRPCAPYCALVLSQPLQNPLLYPMQTQAYAARLLAPKLAALPQFLQLQYAYLCAFVLSWIRMRHPSTATVLPLDDLMPSAAEEHMHDVAAAGSVEESLQATSAGAKLAASLSLSTLHHLERLKRRSARGVHHQKEPCSSWSAQNVDLHASISLIHEVVQLCRRYRLRVLESMLVACLPMDACPRRPLQIGPDALSTAQSLWAVSTGAYRETDGLSADQIISNLVRPFSRRISASSTSTADQAQHDEGDEPKLTDRIHGYEEWVPDVTQKERAAALTAAKCVEKPETLMHSRCAYCFYKLCIARHN